MRDKLECFTPYFYPSQVVTCLPVKKGGYPQSEATLKTQCYKTFYGSNLSMYMINLCVCPWQAFPASLKFVGKAMSLP